MTSPNQIIIRNPSAQILYSSLYSAAWMSGSLWLPNQAWEIEKDPATWEKVRRDPVVEHAISGRLHSIAAREWRVLPGGEEDDSKRLAELFERVFEEMQNLTATQYQLSQGILHGSSFGYIRGEREDREFEIPSGDAGVQSKSRTNLWVPKAIEPIDPRRVRFVANRGQNAQGHTVLKTVEVEIGTQQPGVFKRITNDQWANFVKVIYDDDESRLGYGRGLIGAIYFYHYAKGVTLREGLKGIERWAQGLKVVKVAPDRPGSVERTNDELQQEYLDVIDKSMARNTIVMQHGDDLDVKFPDGSGTSMTMSMLEYLDKGLTQLLLGSVLPTGGGDSKGSHARAEVEEDASERLVIYDRRVIDEAIERDLVGQFLRLNKPQLEQLGLGKAKKPKIRSVNSKRQDPEIAARIAETMLRSGADLRRDEYYEKTGWTPPKPGEEVIKGTQSSPGGFGLPDFGGGEPAPEGPKTAFLQRRNTYQQREFDELVRAVGRALEKSRR